jgi:hypothetical protein
MGVSGPIGVNLPDIICSRMDWIAQTHLHRRGVVGVGFGLKQERGRYTRELCIAFFVVSKVVPGGLLWFATVSLHSR